MGELEDFRGIQMIDGTVSGAVVRRAKATRCSPMSAEQLPRQLSKEKLPAQFSPGLAANTCESRVFGMAQFHSSHPVFIGIFLACRDMFVSSNQGGTQVHNKKQRMATNAFHITSQVAQLVFHHTWQLSVRDQWTGSFPI